MFESLVSSRIRRTLLEYLLSHPNDRFYLRGLSKDLGLSVSPLRRELKRLEHSGMLKTIPEGNMLFYTVNTTAPAFLQLQSLGTQDTRHKTQADDTRTAALSPEFLVSSLESGVSGLGSGPWRPHRLRLPILVGVAGAGLAVLLIGGVAHLALQSRYLSAQVAHLVNGRKAAITVMMPPAAASGVMQGARWRVVPGGFGGGFSSDTSAESY